MKNPFVDHYGVSGLGFVAGVAAFLFIICPAAVLGARGLDHHGAVNTCRSYETKLGIDTEFVDYTYWSYECVTQVDGQWVPASDYIHVIQLRELGK